MNYKLRDSSDELRYYSDIEGDVLKHLLKTRGVDDPDKLINTNIEDVYHWSELEQVDEMADFMIDNIGENTVVSIILDNDNDGVTSTAIMKGYLEKVFNCNVNIIVHSVHRKHGINPFEIYDKDINYNYIDETDILIVPDAGTSDYDGIKKLQKDYPELSILIIDHHPCNLQEFPVGNIKDAVSIHPADYLVNPKVCDYPNKELSGAGVVYKVCRAIDEKLDLDYADDYIHLVALGMIGDMMDISVPETRFLCLKGLEHLNTVKTALTADMDVKTGDLFTRELIKHLNKYNDIDKWKDFNFTYVSWNVVPIFNAIARVGSPEDLRMLINAINNSTELIEYQPRRKSKDDPKPPIEMITIQSEILRIGTNYRSTQSRWSKKIQKQIVDDIEELGLDKKNMIMVNACDYFEKPIQYRLSGLIASQIAEEYMKPTLVLKSEEDGIYYGSGRNFNFSPVEDFRNELNNNTNIVALGHDSAFGCRVPVKTYDAEYSKINKVFDEYNMTPTHLVDFIVRFNQIKARDIREIAEHNDMFGVNLPKPKFLVKAVIDTSDTDVVQVFGTRKNVLKIRGNQSRARNSIRQVDMIMLRGGGKALDEMRNIKTEGINLGEIWDKIELEAICEATVNEYEGKTYAQLLIKEFNSKPYDDSKRTGRDRHARGDINF